MNPAEIKLFLKEYHAERKRLANDAVNVRSKVERDLAEVSRRLERAMAAMLSSSAAVEGFTSAIAELEAEKRRLKSELKAHSAPVNVVSVHPQAVERYLRVVDDLAGGAARWSE